MGYTGDVVPLLKHFSNPDVSYLGVPTGTATANNARVVRENMVRIPHGRGTRGVTIHEAFLSCVAGCSQRCNPKGEVRSQRVIAPPEAASECTCFRSWRRVEKGRFLNTHMFVTPSLVLSLSPRRKYANCCSGGRFAVQGEVRDRRRLQRHRDLR